MTYLSKVRKQFNYCGLILITKKGINLGHCFFIPDGIKSNQNSHMMENVFKSIFLSCDRRNIEYQENYFGFSGKVTGIKVKIFPSTVTYKKHFIFLIFTSKCNTKSVRSHTMS